MFAEMSEITQWGYILTPLILAVAVWIRGKAALDQIKATALKADEVAVKVEEKSSALEKKLDVNTEVTNSVNTKTDTIVNQTNGAFDEVRALVTKIAERVDKLETYNHETAHRTLDALQAIHLKLTVVQSVAEERARAEDAATIKTATDVAKVVLKTAEEKSEN